MARISLAKNFLGLTSSHRLIILRVLSRDSSVILLALSCNDSSSLSCGPSPFSAPAAMIPKLVGQVPKMTPQLVGKSLKNCWQKSAADTHSEPNRFFLRQRRNMLVKDSLSALVERQEARLAFTTSWVVVVVWARAWIKAFSALSKGSLSNPSYHFRNFFLKNPRQTLFTLKLERSYFTQFDK